MTEYIHIVNWGRFQHYRKREPVWIKNYVSLLSNDDYLTLSTHQRGVLQGLWLLYASHHGHVHLDTRLLSRQLNARVSRRTIEALVQAGFLLVSASRDLAPRYQDAIPEKEIEKERGLREESRNGFERCPHCDLPFAGERSLRAHLKNVHDELGVVA